MAPSALKIAEDGAQRTEAARDGAKRADLDQKGFAVFFSKGLCPGGVRGALGRFWVYRTKLNS